MGSPLGPFLANTFMPSIEEDLILTLWCLIRLCLQTIINNEIRNNTFMTNMVMLN